MSNSSHTMFKNYLKIAVRSFVGQKFYSVINTVGLALGTAACILILLFVQDELSYENGFPNNEHIYRLVEDFPMGPHLSQSATVPFPTKNTLMADFPEITKAAFIFRPSSWGNTPVLKLEAEEYYEDDFIFAEQSFLEIYDLTFLKGNEQDALTGPDKLILTSTAAKKYFGDEDPIGKRLNLSNFRDLEVVAVVEDLPGNTHLQFSMIASFDTFKSFFANNPTFFETQWVWVAAWLYFTVEDPADAQKISDALPEFVKKHFPASLADTGLKLQLQKANDIHLNSNRELEFETNGNIRHVYLFSFIAVLVLIIAVINFMNLATSRSAKRGKEVGLRKVMGAHKKMLVAQFMGEALLTSFFSLVLAIVIISITLPWFNELTGKTITFDLFDNPHLLTGMVALCIVTGVLAGSYPALILSAFQPTEVLKGKPSISGKGNLLRKGLVVSQFVISISLIICIGIVYKQLHYIHSKDMGFNQQQVLMVDVGPNFFAKYGGFKSELLKNSDIQSVTLLGGSIPGALELIENAFVATGMPEEQQQWFSVLFASHDFEKTLDLEFLQGHSFQIGSSSDSVGYIINESAARALGWGDDVVGRSIDRLGNGNVLQSGAVIGVVKDFNYRPLYDPIKPLVISLGGNTLSIKVQSEDLKQTLATIEKEWSAQFEDVPFRYSFMDDNFDLLYRKEDKFGKTIEYFSVLAIFIACLGLLGLSSFTTESRRKEIAIRKVNGASTAGLVALLTRDFSILIAIAFIIATPTAYFLGSLWLSNFAYKTDIGVSVFLLAGVISLVLAVLTVSYHTIKAAITNPINSLRYE